MAARAVPPLFSFPIADPRTGYPSPLFVQAWQTLLNQSAAAGATGVPGGAVGSLQYNNAGGFGGLTVGGDGALNTSTGHLTVSKTGGTPFAPSATTDTTNAANITSGVLGAARGGAGTVNGILQANGSGLVSAVTIGVGLTYAGGTLSALPTILISTSAANAYTVVTGDRGKLLNFNNSLFGPVVTLPQAIAPDFPAGWWCFVQNIGGLTTNPGALALTPTTSTINGQTAYNIWPNGAAIIVSDGTNWQVIPLIGFGSPSAVNTGYAIYSAGVAPGNGAVDLQIFRSGSSSRVASGIAAFAAGSQNTASGNEATAIGFFNTASAQSAVALGQANNVSGAEAVGIGDGNVVSGAESVVLGQNGTDSGNQHTFAVGFGGPSVSTTFPGRAQWEEHVLWASTSAAVSVQLTADGAAAGANNVINLPTKTAALFFIEFLGVDKTTGAAVVTYGLGSPASPALMNRFTGNIALAAGNPSFAAGPNIGAPALGAAPAIVADTVNQGLTLTVTPPAANTDVWVFIARVHMLLTRYN